MNIKQYRTGVPNTAPPFFAYFLLICVKNSLNGRIFFFGRIDFIQMMWYNPHILQNVDDNMTKCNVFMGRSLRLSPLKILM